LAFSLHPQNLRLSLRSHAVAAAISFPLLLTPVSSRRPPRRRIQRRFPPQLTTVIPLVLGRLPRWCALSYVIPGHRVLSSGGSSGNPGIQNHSAEWRRGWWPVKTRDFIACLCICPTATESPYRLGQTDSHLAPAYMSGSLSPVSIERPDCCPLREDNPRDSFEETHRCSEASVRHDIRSPLQLTPVIPAREPGSITLTLLSGARQSTNALLPSPQPCHFIVWVKLIVELLSLYVRTIKESF
jgi:hypothetical protein